MFTISSSDWMADQTPFKESQALCRFQSYEQGTFWLKLICCFYCLDAYQVGCKGLFLIRFLLLGLHFQNIFGEKSSFQVLFHENFSPRAWLWGSEYVNLRKIPLLTVPRNLTRNFFPGEILILPDYGFLEEKPYFCPFCTFSSSLAEMWLKRGEPWKKFRVRFLGTVRSGILCRLTYSEPHDEALGEKFLWNQT